VPYIFGSLLLTSDLSFKVGDTYFINGIFCILCNVQGAVRVMAKDLVRTRHQIEKFYKLKSQLQGVSLRIQVFYGDYYYLAYMVNIIGFIMS
jgi:hypothetical protein